MKKITGLLLLLIAAITVMVINIGCAATAAIQAKSGSQLWGENCIRCHNAPPSADYSPAQWETIGMHMKLRANLTDDEATKIVGYLKASD